MNIQYIYDELKHTYETGGKIQAVKLLKMNPDNNFATLMECKIFVEKMVDDYDWVYDPKTPIMSQSKQIFNTKTVVELYELRTQRKNAERAIQYIKQIGGTVNNVNTIELRDHEISECITLVRSLPVAGPDDLRRLGNILRTFSKE